MNRSVTSFLLFFRCLIRVAGHQSVASVAFAEPDGSDGHERLALTQCDNKKVVRNIT